MGNAALGCLAGGFGKIGKVASFANKAKRGKVAKEGVYEFPTKSGKPYVGQSQDIPRRLREHQRTGKLPPENVDKVVSTEVTGGKTAREIAEQQRINDLGGLKNLENKRNPIGPGRQSLLNDLK